MPRKTLKGLRVLNTRPAKQAKPLSQQINDYGGISIECPTIEIKETPPLWLKLLPDLNQVDQAVFISANAVYHGLNLLNLKNIPWPRSIAVIAIGQGTAKALKEFDIKVSAMPDLSDSEHMLELSSLQQINKQTILIFKGIGGRTHLEEKLNERGAHLIKLDVYQRVLPKIPQHFIESLWQDDKVDIILLTSEESIHNLFTLFNPIMHSWLKSKTCLVLSERLAKSASSWGMNKIIICHPKHIMDALLNYYQGLPNG